jgi:uncharacterized membrane protein (UPF0127 family)
MRRLLAGVLLTLACGACASGPKAPAGGVVLRFGKHAMGAEVAATQRQRERGLMARTRLPRDSGMIFLFPPGKPVGAFWMKDTLIPLSIAFMVQTDETHYRVVSVMDMQPCRADPCTLYSPGSPYNAAVETSLGWYRENGVLPGTVVEAPRGMPTAS